MKKLLFVTMLLLTSIAWGQSTHTVTLTWAASPDAAGNPSLVYDIYRAPAACPATPLTFVKVGTTAPLATSFTDSAVPLGTMCYAVTSLINGVESVQSNPAPAVILPAAPTGLLVSKVN